MNPLAYLLPALAALLKAPPLTWDGADVGAFEHLKGNSKGHYLLVEQPTAISAPGSTACKQWSCTALVDVVTQFPSDLVTSAPVESLATQAIARIEGDESSLTPPVLALPAGYQCGPAELVLHSEVRELDGSLVAVRRLLRYRWQVYYHAPVLAGVVTNGFPYGLPFAMR